MTDIRRELEAMTDKLRGIRLKPGEQNGHNFHKGKSRLKAIERANAKRIGATKKQERPQ